ncbi:hypothetical protein [Maricaulis sp.]|uniref:hypothetical protein n=1 Tax=Maricaulis sp. TaxID=1486257 RepID=UPI003A8DE09D
MLKTIKEGRLGKHTLRIVETGKGLQGIAFIDAERRSAIMAGDDLEELWERLVVEVGQQAAEYVGYDGAIARFKQIFPTGFADPRYHSKERDYKLAAIARLAEAAPLEDALAGKADPEAVLRASHTNLLFRSESIALRAILLHTSGRKFVQAAAEMAMGDVAQGLATMSRIASDVDRKSWPLVTYLPFLWQPDEHMFLKPTVAKGFAERVGHRFAYEYSSDIKAEVYAGLLDLTAGARRSIAALEPADNVDVQSFIWAVAKYTDEDAAED